MKYLHIVIHIIQGVHSKRLKENSDLSIHIKGLLGAENEALN